MYCDEKLNTRLASRDRARVELRVDQIGTLRGDVVDFNDSYIIMKVDGHEIYYDWLYIISLRFV